MSCENVNVTTQPVSINGTNVDAFGRLRVSQPYTLFDSSNRYAADNQFDTSVVSGGTTTYLPNESTIQLNVNTTSGAEVVRQSYRVFPYQPGKGLLCLATFQAATAVAVTADATLTTDEVLTSRLFVRADGAVASDVYLTTPTAAELIAALTTKRGVTTAVGDTFEIICINNETTTNENFDIVSGTGVTFGGATGSNYSETVVNETVARFIFVVTNVTASSEAIVFYRA